LLIVIAMLRDESDILSAWLRHMIAICDQVLVVDHLSNDGSSEILRGFADAGLPIRYWRMEEPGYWQSAVTTELARYAFNSGAEWVLPFDVDEFLDVESKAHLQAILRNHEQPLGFWRWRHVTPTAEVIESGGIDWNTPQLLGNPTYAPGNGGKVVLHKSLFHSLPGFRLGSGNHLLHGTAFAKALRGDAMGTLWHLPVRSRDQITRKLRRDLASHLNTKTAALPELEGAANLKSQLLQRFSDAANSKEMMQRMGLGYGEMGIRCLDDTELLANAVAISPRLPMIDQGPLRATESGTLGKRVPELGNARTKHALVRARLSTGTVEITPESRWELFLHNLENGLSRWFTPGLRLARFLATSYVRSRLDMPARAKD
jgi:hypothetical protein